MKTPIEFKKKHKKILMPIKVTSCILSGSCIKKKIYSNSEAHFNLNPQIIFRITKNNHQMSPKI